MDDGIVQLAAVIDAHLAACGAERDQLIFGSGDARVIAVEIDRFCRDELGGAVARPLLYETSQGAVAGVELADGRRVVVKAHKPEPDLLARLHESVRVQMHLASRGIYATTVCGGPAPIGRTLATVEAYVTGGVTRDGHDPAVRAALARSLYAIVESCRPLVAGSSLPPHYLARPYDQLWPDGNDFAERSHGAEWIDDVGRAARARMHPAGELVVGHGDWRVQHLLFDGDRVVAAHDWVSLCKEREPALVGFTAFAFCVDWSRQLGARTPTLGEARALVAEYEAARGRAFTREERRLCGAIFAYSCAYLARCFWGIDDERAKAGSFHHLVATQGAALVDL
jgi:hypothetical protein